MMKQYFLRWFLHDQAADRTPLFPAFLVLMAVAFLLYARSFTGGWTMDDFPVLVDNPDIRSLGHFLKDSFPGRPLRELTFLLDYQLFGLDPAGYRLQNIFWHGLNAWLLWALALRLRLPLFAAWSAALLFACHPVMVEVVANTSHRKDSLALAFVLLSMHAYLAFYQGEGKQQRYWLLAAAVAAWLVALQAKQNALVLPALWLTCERVLVPRERRLLLRHPRLLFGAGVGGAIALLGWFLSMGGIERLSEAIRGPLAKMNQAEAWSLSGYYLAVLKSWTFMAGKLLWPLQLGVEYTFPLPESWVDPWVLGGFLLVVAGLILLFLLRRSAAGLFAVVWLMVFWLPTANLWPLAYFAADRYLYAPWAGGALLLAVGLVWLAGRAGRHVAVSALIVLVLFYNVLTWRQIKSWSSEEALWVQAYRVNPTSAFVLNNMGNIALGRNQQGEALRYYQESFSNNPYNPTSNYNLGFFYLMRGEQGTAQPYLENFLVVADPNEYEEQRRSVEQILRSWSNDKP